MNLPKIPDSAIQGAGGEYLVALMLHGFATIKKVTPIDYGIDIEAELLDKNYPTGRTFCVQVKFVSSTPRIKQGTKNNWKQRIEPVFVLWIKSNGSSEKPSYEKAVTAKKYFKRFPSRFSLPEEKKYKEYDDALFLTEINAYWDEYDKSWSKISDDKKPQKSKKDLAENSNKIQNSTPIQALDLIKGVEDAISNGKPLDDYQQIRLHLFSSAQLYRFRIPSEILGNHELQLLYTFKEKVKLTNYETILIARTIVSDEFNLKAGWFWVKFNSKLKDLLFITEYFIKNDYSESVVLGSLQLLSLVWDDKHLKFFEDNRQTITENIKVKELEICKENPSVNTFEYCKKYLNDSEERVKTKAQEVYTYLITKLKPHEAVVLLNGENPLINKYKIASNFYKDINEAELRNLMGDSDDWIRVEVIKELVKRDALLEAELFELLKDKNWNVRFLGISKLQGKGTRFKADQIRTILLSRGNDIHDLLSRHIYEFDEDELYRTTYSTDDLDTLKKKSYWGFGGEIVYEMLSIKDPQFIQQIREDLINEFEERKNKLFENEAFVKGLSVQEVSSLWEKYNATVKGMFIEKGLEILLEKGNIDDRKIAYRFLNSDNFSIKSISKKILLKYGQIDDIPTLLELAKKEKDNSFLHKAIELSDDKEKINNNLLISNNDDFVQYALAYSLKFKIKLKNDLIVNLLKNKNEVLRKYGAVYLYENINRVEAKRILKEYYSNESYFYNVVSLLDVLIYAPSFLKSKLVRKIKEEILSRVK